MIIECANCGTKFTVREEAIKPGLKLRCSKCATIWQIEPPPALAPEPEPPAMEPPAESEVAPEPVEDIAPAPEETPEPFIAAAPQIMSELDDTHRSKLASVGLLAASLALLAAGAFFGQARIVQLWPPSLRIYQLAKLVPPRPGQGLELRDVHAVLDPAAPPATSLTIAATVVNTQKSAVPVPKLQAEMVASNGQKLQWMLPAGVDHLDPQATIAVKTTVDGTNTENGKILLTFSTDNSVQAK